jgi:drug/metabolite transporter (DMT)-like permease
MPSSSRGRVVAAFLAVYLVWGSTYLAIKFAVETLPPFLMAGVRFVTAGAILYFWSQRQRADRGTRAAAEWGWAALVGALLVLGGNGAVVWAADRVPSGVIALLIAATPIWMVLLDWLRPGGRRPTRAVLAGLLLGSAGLALLVNARGAGTSGRIDPLGAAAVLFGSLSWAVGSLVSRSQRLPRSPILSTGMQMLTGGAFMAVAGLLLGETRGFALADVSARSALAWLYLMTVGSLVGYTAYIWLLGHVSAAKAATYAYVNPVVAVLLGWAFADEPVTAGVLLAAAVIVSAVALITVGQSRPTAAVADAGPECHAADLPDADGRATART